MVSNEDLQEMLNKFPGSYDKSLEGVFGKLVKVIIKPLVEIGQELEKMESIKNLSTAYGRHLDRHGENVNQIRGGLSDEIYRLLIRSKIMSNTSPGDTNSLIQYVATILQIPLEQVAIIEQDHDYKDYEPARFDIKVPLTALDELIITLGEFLEIIDSMSPAGVKTWLFALGTFKLVDEPEFGGETRGWPRGTAISKNRVLDREQSFQPDESTTSLINYLFDTEDRKVKLYESIIDKDDSDGIGGLSDIEQEIGGTLGDVYHIGGEAIE